MTNGMGGMGGGGGGFDPSMISGVFGAVDGAIAGWHEQTILKNQFAASGPCEGAAHYAEIAGNWIGPTVDDASNIAAGMSEYLHGAIVASIQAKGEHRSGVSGGTSLTEYVLSQVGNQTNRLVKPSGGPVNVATMRAYIRDRMPDGSDLLNARENLWSANTGAIISSGVYISQGKYTGTTIRNWIRDWIAVQVAQASPSVLTEARSLLGQSAGTWRGSWMVGGWGYGTWSPADGGAPGSKLARLTFILQDAYRLQAELQEQCTGVRSGALFSGKARDVLPFVALGAAVFIFVRGT